MIWFSAVSPDSRSPDRDYTARLPVTSPPVPKETMGYDSPSGNVSVSLEVLRRRCAVCNRRWKKRAELLKNRLA